jgi:DNA-directed RNA polymerase specialized sigma24 family protein|tara:strand:- start:1483 stop:1992 length:510 start_codon:yes stop_codon:yes gene_type:complete
MSTEVDNILNILVKDDDVWLKMAEEISGNSKVQAKDLLHDFYIALHSKVDNGKVKINDILYNDSLNKAFIYKMMHNIFIDNIRNDKDILIDKELKNIIEADNEPYIDIEKVVDEIVDGFYWFDRKLFNLYRKKFHSIRKLSAATNISHVVVWRTINNCIKEIKKKINEK